MKAPGRIFYWKQHSFLRLLMPFTGGILAGKCYAVELLFELFAIAIMLIIVTSIIRFSKFFDFSWIAGVAIHVLLFSFGVVISHTHRDIRVKETPCFGKGHSNYLVLKLLSEPVPKKNSRKCVAQVNWLVRDKTCFLQNEKLLVYFSSPQFPLHLRAGTEIIIEKQPEEIQNSIHSGFDYKKYCSLRHIYEQVFLNKKDFLVIENEKQNPFFQVLEQIRTKIRAIIVKQIPSGSENGLLEALMIGYTDDLDPGLLKSYADSGVIHIIAISGLHLALICHILQLLISTGKGNTSRLIRLGFMIGILWMYSLLSGASPSVIRSAMMFSIVLSGRYLLREASLYNTLAASAFLLLCFDPFWIRDTGFQLSYAAVVSLAVFSRPVRNLIRPQNKLLAAIWEACSVSIAAQVLVTPISIFYFGRFPSYFIMANLLAVPLSSAILIGGILLTAFAWARPVAVGLGWLLKYGIAFLNNFVQWTSRLPGAVIHSLIISLPQLILCYCIIFSFFHFFQKGRKNWLFSGLGFICLFQASFYFK